MKKSYPIILLIFIAWLFSSCDSKSTPEPLSTSTMSVPEVQIKSATPTIAAETVEPVSEPSPVVSSSDSGIAVSPALKVAQELPVRGRASATDYSREAFGSAWKDVDRNGCDTRNDILQRDFSSSILKTGTGNCKVIGGTWTDPYSNESYTFNEAPSGAQIDHVVSLKNAWQMGADLWSDQQRLEFANDPLNLRVTIASLNRQKSDANAASWLPPYKPGRCNFIATQVAVKSKWGLFVTDAEKQVFISILSKPECQQITLPN